MKVSKRFCARLGVAGTFLVLGASVAVLILVPRHSKPVAVADVGTIAPAFELPALNGPRFNLADSRGQVVVLFFSALSDPRIGQYYDRVERLARKYEDDGRVRILGINITGGEYDDPLLFRVDNRLAACKFPALLDDKASVAHRYSALNTPLVVIIDANGVVRYRGPVEQGGEGLMAPQNTFVEEAIRALAANATLAAAK